MSDEFIILNRRRERGLTRGRRAGGVEERDLYKSEECEEGRCFLVVEPTEVETKGRDSFLHNGYVRKVRSNSFKVN